MRQADRIIVNTISNYALTLVTMATQLVMIPVVVKHLDKSGFGLATMVLVPFGFFEVMAGSFGRALHRFIPQDLATNDARQISRTFSTALAGYVLMGLMGAVSTWFAFDWMLAGAEVSSAVMADGRQAMWVLIVWLVVGFPLWGYRKGLEAIQRYGADDQIIVPDDHDRLGSGDQPLAASAGIQASSLARVRVGRFHRPLRAAPMSGSEVSPSPTAEARTRPCRQPKLRLRTSSENAASPSPAAIAKPMATTTAITAAGGTSGPHPRPASQVSAMASVVMVQARAALRSRGPSAIKSGTRAARTSSQPNRLRPTGPVARWIMRLSASPRVRD